MPGAYMKIAAAVIAGLMACSAGWAKEPAVLEQGRALLAGASYYDAVIALEPLLLQKDKSKAQQEAYIIADKACRKLVLEEHLLMREYETLYPLGSGTGPGDMKWEKILALNRLGAGITYDGMAGDYDYSYDLLRTLVKKYPDSKYAPAARFYVIRPGINDLAEVERELRELAAYVKKYPGLKEADLARLKTARINDNLWETLGQNGWPPFSSGDTDKDRERGAQSREKALKQYEKLLKGSKLDAATVKGIGERYKELKAFKISGRYYIISD